VFALAVLSAAVAQYALDADLRAGGGRNPQRVPYTVPKPIYTVNPQTGELQYNRANAFNDPVYTIYQRYSLDRFQYFEPVPSAADLPGVNRSLSTRTRAYGQPAPAPRAATYATRRGPASHGAIPPARQPAARGSGSLGLGSPTYSATRAAQPRSGRAPSLKVNSGRAPR
jgi:hypothetical protein